MYYLGQRQAVQQLELKDAQANARRWVERSTVTEDHEVDVEVEVRESPVPQGWYSQPWWKPILVGAWAHYGFQTHDHLRRKRENTVREPAPKFCRRR